MPFEWNTSLTLAVSSEECPLCEGNGMRWIRSRYPGRGRWRPCRCALLGVFRCCYERWLQIESGDQISQVQYGIRADTAAYAGYSMPDLEYSADFVLLAKRHLTNATERAIFQLHFMEERDWRDCCRRLDMERGAFYHAVYRIEQRMGRVYAETQPYPLFPMENYFAGVRRKPGTSLTPTPLQIRRPLAA